MLNHQGELDIFVEGNFLVDRSLPKFAGMAGDADDGIPTAEVWYRAGQMIEGPFTIHGEDGGGGRFSIRRARRPPRSRSWLSRLLRRRDSPMLPESSMTVEEFFRSLKNSAEELRIVAERAAGYEDALRKAKASGQTALLESLGKNLVAVRAEAQLVAMGLGKYLEAATLEEFARKSDKALRLDWIQNFTRIIPDALLALKRAADERHIFDNYTVVHYDPQGKSWAKTEMEKKVEVERRRDPILFGVIDGRKRLYFVGDWVDEFCDLTLDQIADSLGKAAIHTME